MLPVTVPAALALTLTECEPGTKKARAHQCGFKVIADTTIRLWHIGSYPYGWEDSGTDRPRTGSFTLHVGKPLGQSQ
jgi:hypothetical protein